MIRRASLVAVIAAVVVGAPALHAYLKIGYTLNGKLVALAWSDAVKYRITNRDIANVTAAQLQIAVAHALTEWSAPADVGISSQFLGLTGIEPGVDDGQTVIGFKSRPDLDRTLGATTFEFDKVTGQFLGADIFINSIFSWSAATNGETSRFDLESVIVHEVGHLLGLGHSALGETEPRSGGGRTVLGKRAVMFPIAYPPGSTIDRTIEADDIAGITDIYGGSESNRQLGAISGKVTLNGSGVYGAHVTAFNAATSELIGGFTLDAQGNFVIGSLNPGVYVVRVEPLDDADVDGFFDDDPPVNLSFKATYYSKHVVVPSGGTSGSIEIKVRSK